jgi:hypothetical protein
MCAKLHLVIRGAMLLSTPTYELWLSKYTEYSDNRHPVSSHCMAQALDCSPGGRSPGLVTHFGADGLDP